MGVPGGADSAPQRTAHAQQLRTRRVGARQPVEERPGRPRGLLQASLGRLMSTPEENLAALGLSVPAVARPVANYVPAIRSGIHVFTSGQLPMHEGALLATGKVGGEVSIETAT